jgi:hypothetical protein
MRIVIDTNKIHPIVRRIFWFVCTQFAIMTVFAMIESFIGYRLTWWEGYALGFSAGIFTWTPIKGLDK